MYKNKEQEREAARIRKQKQRNKDVTPSENVTPFEQDVTPLVTPNVTPYQEEPISGHPDAIRCGAIVYQWHDAPTWLQRSYMGSTRKWESMLTCVPDYSRPEVLGGDRG